MNFNKQIGGILVMSDANFNEQIKDTLVLGDAVSFIAFIPDIIFNWRYKYNFFFSFSSFWPCNNGNSIYITKCSACKVYIH